MAGHSVDEENNNDQLLFLPQKTGAWSRPTNVSDQIPMEKVLIFSQFLEHIHVIEQQVPIIF